jgi:UDP-N-acetylglucosamine 4,6-dehydratase
MKNLINGIILLMLAWDRWLKILFAMLIDYILLILSLWVSLTIRDNAIFIPTLETSLLISFCSLVAIPIFYFSGLYKSLVRYSGINTFLSIIIAMLAYSFLWFLVLIISKVIIKPYDFLAINLLVTISLLGGVRFLARRWFFLDNIRDKKNAVIYGAGSAGIELAYALSHSPEINIVGFIDDNKTLHGKYLDWLKIFSPNQINKLISKSNISEIFIAMPSLSKLERAKLLSSLKKYPLIIKSIPSLSDLAEGTLSISDLKKIRIEDLLNRETVRPNQDLLIQNIEDKNILVTGAGGSIGSQLCRNIVKLKPNLLVLFEISEAALYLIERELREQNLDIKILAVIGNVTRRNRLDYIIKNYQINTIYHAAAYKHVPLVEKNAIPGIRCNIFGTLTCINAAIDNNVESFVFISTDKAVRPTNIMGATKRFAELILQSLSKQESSDGKELVTKVSMVRFGNVLGSSGSVVPLFKSQIEKGGPLTVTDPNIIRYFMTIEEASELVIQAGAMGRNGDIFLLDMGEPVHVLDLAKDMIRLSGKTIKDDSNPDGDIEIIFTGLRPGEKLYEELLIDQKSETTIHKQIMKADDQWIEWRKLEQYLTKLEQAIISNDFGMIREIFLETVSGYNPKG